MRDPGDRRSRAARGVLDFCPARLGCEQRGDLIVFLSIDRAALAIVLTIALSRR